MALGNFLTLNSHNINILNSAVIQTFKNRQTKYTEKHPIWDTTFYEDASRLQQWKSFLKKNGADEIIDFKSVMEKIQTILKPIYESLK